MWRDENTDLKGNIRDHASIQQLIVLINLESMNSELIKLGLSQSERAARLNKMAIEQLTTLNKYDNTSNIPLKMYFLQKFLSNCREDTYDKSLQAI